MKRILLTIIACTVVLGVGSFASAKDAPDLCEMVGTTSADRQIWRWTGPAVSESQPVEIIFTNHDLLTDIMPFSNGGYYNYAGLLYNAGQTTGIVDITTTPPDGSQPPVWRGASWYDLQGRKLAGRPTQKGVYINKGKKTGSHFITTFVLLR